MSLSWTKGIIGNCLEVNSITPFAYFSAISATLRSFTASILSQTALTQTENISLPLSFTTPPFFNSSSSLGFILPPLLLYYSYCLSRDCNTFTAFCQVFFVIYFLEGLY